MFKQLLLLAIVLLFNTTFSQSQLENNFQTPPSEARPRAYWWWLNSQVNKESITRELEEMKAKGYGGAILFDAGNSANSMVR